MCVALYRHADRFATFNYFSRLLSVQIEHFLQMIRNLLKTVLPEIVHINHNWGFAQVKYAD